MRPLRIGFVSVDDLDQINLWSGIPRSIWKHLEQEPVELVKLSPLSRAYRHLLLPQRVIGKLRGKSALSDRHPAALWSFARQIRKRLDANPVDVVFAPSSIPITWLRCRQPVVFWTDAVWHGYRDYYGVKVGRLDDWLAKRQERQALERATFAVYASSWAAEQAARLTRSDKIRVLPFGSNLPVSHAAPAITEMTSARLSRMQRQLTLLFVGVSWERKGGEVAVEAVRLLNQRGTPARLKLVGCKAPRALPDFVEDLGFVDRSTTSGLEQLTELYRQSDLFILPTKAEAAGIVFCEASAFGLPILTYATGGTVDYVRQNVNGLALPAGSSPEAFAQAASALVANSEHYMELSQRAFAEYEQRLNWRSSVHSLTELLRESCDRRT
ncbi:MAG TPA: glycosyltransferase family 4 protein [Polyangiaceae bacterium]|jgi:glycosyltransferase involved in cell wall biosynthesis|nr:glycosyltransferase family 4 protein [Polyangiaceae bacterium]